MFKQNENWGDPLVCDTQHLHAKGRQKDVEKWNASNQESPFNWFPLNTWLTKIGDFFISGGIWYFSAIESHQALTIKYLFSVS